jgi:glycosyltransferase involved in cell wall biosynthesis
MAKIIKLKSLSVFYPCYNEQQNIPIFIKQALNFLPEIANKFEIIIINDGSRENTKRIVLDLIKINTNIKLVNHSKNLGYGAALRSGFRKSSYDWIFFTDGDLQFDIRQLKNFIEFTDEYRVILGYRKKRAEGRLRSFNAKLFKIFIDILFRVHVKDIDCAFKLIRADVIKPIKLSSTGAFTSAEFLYKFKKRGVHFKQLPVNHYKRKFGSPTGNNVGVIIKAGIEAFKLYLKIKWESLSK